MIHNSQQAIASMRAVERRTLVAIPPALNGEMNRMVGRVQAHMSRDSGDLIESVKAIPASGKVVVAAGVHVDSPHAAPQEFGTIHNPPHPSLRSAARETSERLKNSIPRALRSAL